MVYKVNSPQSLFSKTKNIINVQRRDKIEINHKEVTTYGWIVIVLFIFIFCFVEIVIFQNVDFERGYSFNTAAVDLA